MCVATRAFELKYQCTTRYSWVSLQPIPRTMNQGICQFASKWSHRELDDFLSSFVTPRRGSVVDNKFIRRESKSFVALSKLFRSYVRCQAKIKGADTPPNLSVYGKSSDKKLPILWMCWRVFPNSYFYSKNRNANHYSAFPGYGGFYWSLLICANFRLKFSG